MCNNRHAKTHLIFAFLVIPLLLGGSVAWGQLNANFTVSKNGGCAPLAVAFTNTTTGASANAVYSWDLGNGNTAAIPNPGAIYTNEQVYTVTLRVQDGAQSSVKTQLITVYSKPVVEFSSNVAKGCLPLAVNFTSNPSPGSGTIANYYWDFGDGSAQQGATSVQPHTYSFTQTATVSLTVTNSYGCYNTLQKKDIVTVIPRLTSSFTASQTILCHETDAVQFTNNSNGPGSLSYQWDFGDGAGSTDKDPSYIFNKKGIYTVRLTTTSSEGCTATSTQTNYLNVASFHSDFDAPSLICKNGLISFNSKSTPFPNSSVWELNGIPVSYGSYMSYAFNTPGDYTITLRNTFGNCKDVATKQVSVKDIPEIRGFLIDTKDSCGAPAKVNFKDTTGTAVAWEWDFNYNWLRPQVNATSQAPVHTYTSEGFYNVMLKVTNADGCSNSAIRSFQTIRPYVTITAANTGGTIGLASCGALTLAFKANSADPITSYNWVFGDGGVSTDAEPVYTYIRPGNYQVQLNYTTRNGCTGTAYFNSVSIYQKPEVDFSAVNTNICGNTPAQFIGTVSPSQNTGGLSWNWDFGDHTSPAFANIVVDHSYQQEGTYTIRLIVTNGLCSDTAIKTDYIKVDIPFAGIGSVVNTCNGTRGEVAFTSSSREATSLVWNFGDGSPLVTTPGTQTSISHTYTKTGSYGVMLTAVNGQCRVNAGIGAVVLLKQQPVLSGDKTSFCIEEGLQVKVTNYEANPLVINNSYSHYSVQFQYGDGTNFSGNVLPDHWNWNNQFNGRLSGFDKSKNSLRVITTSAHFGCTDTSNYIPLAIKTAAAAGFEIVTNNVCYKNAIALKDTSKSYSGSIQKWLWNFGDGQTSTQSGTVSHTYNTPGNYYVSLQVTDASGCTSGTNSISHTVQVNGPKADFSPSGYNVNLNTTVYFNNYTNNYGSLNTSYQWLLNEVPFSTAFAPSYTFTQAGTYTVKLVATNAASGCSSEASQVIVVKNFNAGFNFSRTNITGSSCPPLLVRFNNTSSNYTSLKWDFGDGFTIENVVHPSHIYEKPGNYYITLYTYGPSGLKDQYLDSLKIPQPSASIAASATEGCRGHMVTLNATANNANSYTWDFGDGNIQQTADSFATHKYTVPGTYVPVLLMRDGNSGCTGSSKSSDAILIHPDPVVNITPADPIICLGASITLQASGGIQYAWSPTNELNDINSASPVASPHATSTWQVQATDEKGCKNTAAITVTVIQPVTVHLNPDTAVCAGSPVPLQASGAELYTWINTTTGLNDTSIPNPVAQPATSTQYTIAGSDAHHCFSDTAQVHIEIFPLPSVNAGTDTEVWAGNPAQLHASGSNDITQWTWSPDSALSCTNCPDPVSKAQAETMYTITVQNQHGCKASDQVLVKLLCDEGRVAIPTGFTPNNDGNNDVFMIKGIGVVNHLVIFNRWGQKVFDRSNFIAGDRSLNWDGSFNGHPAAEGTYVYMVELECPSGGRFMRKGTITLIR